MSKSITSAYPRFNKHHAFAAILDRVKVVTGPLDTPCWEFQGARNPKYGHGVVTFQKRTEPTHRLVYEYVNGVDLPIDAVVRHRCDNGPCCNPDHLITGSRADNIGDCVEKGRHAYGAKARHAKLTDEQVAEMRRLARGGMKQWQIAQQFGVSQQIAGKAICGDNWKHVEEPPLPKRGWGPGKKRT